MLPNMCCFPSRDDSKDGGVSEAFSKEVAPIGFHRNDQPFRFLDLPIDLRVMVYSHVLAWPKFTRLRHYGKCESSNFWLAHTGNSVPLCPYDKRPVWPPERTSPAILRVCRQIKHEALGELLKTPLVFDHVLPFLTNIFGCKSAIPRYLTSYISPPLICKARRVVISIGGSPNSSSYDHWHGWVHFLTYLWFSWRESPPPLEHIMVRITKLPPENYDRSSENEFPTIDKSDITRSQQLLLMLAGLLTTVPKACDVEIKANTSYEVYIRQKHFIEENPLPPKWKFYEQLNPAPVGIETALVTFSIRNDPKRIQRRDEANDYLADRALDNNIPWCHTLKITPEITPKKKRAAPKKSSKILGQARDTTHRPKPSATKKQSQTKARKERKRVVRNERHSTPPKKSSSRYNLRSNDAAN